MLGQRYSHVVDVGASEDNHRVGVFIHTGNLVERAVINVDIDPDVGVALKSIVVEIGTIDKFFAGDRNIRFAQSPVDDAADVQTEDSSRV